MKFLGLKNLVLKNHVGVGCAGLLLFHGLTHAEGWAQSAESLQLPQGPHVVDILQTLNQVPSGASLIQKALVTWKASTLRGLMENLKWSDASRTDTVLTRHYNPKTGREERERQVTIYLRQDQYSMDVVLDLAHELVHATSRPSFDPYDPGLTAGKYIFGAIDGEGGEVDAVRLECKVGIELSESRHSITSDFSPGFMPRCQGYLNASGDVIDREKIRLDFYRVGKWYSDLHLRLVTEKTLLSLLSPEVPHLFSSTGHAPYPFALLKEFEELTQLACKNSRNRVRGSKSGSESQAQKEVENFIDKRCRPLKGGALF